jgi:hypothetical protein
MKTGQRVTQVPDRTEVARVRVGGLDWAVFPTGRGAKQERARAVGGDELRVG